MTVDHIVRVGQPPRYSSLGGPGLYGSLGARLVEGCRVLLRAGLPGSVPQFAEVLEASGVGIELCEPVPSVPTVWVLDSPEGRRLVLAEAPDHLEIATGNELPKQQFPRVWRPYPALDGLMLCSPDPCSAGNGCARVVGVDPDQVLARTESWQYWDRLASLRGCVLFPSRLQLSFVGPDPLRAARLLCDKLGVPVVAKLDVEGAVALDDSGTWTVHDSEVRVLDTTGAGDAMTAAAVAALASGRDLATATALGVSVARYALAGWGHEGLVGRDPLDRPLPGVHVRKDSQR